MFCDIADSNNNCNFITGKNCCTGCGRQEQFYGCSDVSVGHALNIGNHVTGTSSLTSFPPQGNVVKPTRPMGFIPIDIYGRDVSETKQKKSY